jgi:hypothetical protein
MVVQIVDSTGARIWLNDTVTSPLGSGFVAGIIESPDDLNDAIVIDTGGGVQVTVAPPSLVTVTARASELVSTADDSQAGISDQGGDQGGE